MNDLTLRRQILDELEFVPHIDAAAIGVSMEDGVVMLTGHVRTFAEKIAAEHAVWRVKGVKAVVEEIQVRLSTDVDMDDSLIAARCLDLVRWNTAVPDQAIRIKVQQGWVTLEGQVDWQYQRDAAQQALQTLEGVVGLDNLLVVKPRVTAEDIRGLIESALSRSSVLAGCQIRVTADGNQVRLEGYVHHWLERKTAERTAWSVPGVRDVENRLLIE